ncbi:TPA: hypothetical protein QEL15_000085 [Stenotrophomonas maltophilia]|nr:hypothetical protein [Stenotrophomonas maltophilia]
MDATEISKVLQGGDLVTITIVAAFAVVPLIKGFHALLHGRDQRRKEFLEIWKKGSLKREDLWLEEAIRHLTGASMSAKLIRHVAKLDWPSAKLRKLAMNARFFEFDEDRETVVWIRRWRERGARLQFEMAACLIGYCVFSFLGFGLILTGGRQGLSDGTPLVLVGAMLVVAAIASFWHFISLVESRSAFLLVNSLSRDGLWASLMRKWRAWRVKSAASHPGASAEGDRGCGSVVKEGAASRAECAAAIEAR